MAVLQSKYRPREYFQSFHRRRQRMAILVAHRRAGKTVAAVNDIIEKATYNTRPDPRYAYIAPFLRQAKDIAWKYLKEFAAPFSPKINESELWVELQALPNNPRITIYGADNPDSLRGIYLDGAVLDEFGNMRAVIFEEILYPTLMDRNGWIVFMGTPNGPNHFRDMWYERVDDDRWFTLILPVTETGIFTQEQLDDARRLMTPEQYAQEMLCSFEASVRGAIYAREVEESIAAKRIGSFPFTPRARLDTYMDLGFKDQATIGFVEPRFDGILIGHAYGASMQKIDHYIDYMVDYCNNGGYTLGNIWLPHDAKAKSLQTGRAIIDHFRAANLRPRLVPKLDVIDGIAAVRTIFSQFYINEPECKKLILALKSYQREYDPDLKRYSDNPVHDWSSDWCDMVRYIALTVHKKPRPKVRTLAQHQAVGLHYKFSLDDIWDTAPRGNRRPYG